MNYAKKIIVFSFILSALSMLSSCGTVNGFGKDVSRAGQDIQKAAS